MTTISFVMVPIDMANDANTLLQEAGLGPDSFRLDVLSVSGESGDMLALHAWGPSSQFTDPTPPAGGWSLGSQRTAEVFAAMISGDREDGDDVAQIEAVEAARGVRFGPRLPSLPNNRGNRVRGGFYRQGDDIVEVEQTGQLKKRGRGSRPNAERAI